MFRINNARHAHLGVLTMASMARGSVAALIFLLCLSSATVLSHAQDTDKLLTKVEKAENIQGDGKEVSDTVVSNVVDSAGAAELAR